MGTREGPPLGFAQGVSEEIAQRAAQTIEASAQAVQAAASFVDFVHRSTREYDALKVIVAQATNDFLDLLFDVLHGRGRPALRGARSLVELLITERDVLGSPEIAARYMDQRWIGARLESSLSIEVEELSAKDRKAEEHRLRKLGRDTAQEYGKALAKYGPSFNRQWHPVPLRTRAERYGLAEDYDFYRLASLVLHGASGGVLGLKTEIAGQIVHRTGLALSLCPLAFLQGIQMFDQIVKQVSVPGQAGISFARTLGA